MPKLDLIQGTLDMIILQTLRSGERHGYALAVAIRTGSGEVLQVETGSLYPALHRLEKRGWLKARWGETEQKQRAKFYQLTAAGSQQLVNEQSRWAEFTAAISRLAEVKP